MRIHSRTIDIVCLAGLLVFAAGGAVVSVKSARAQARVLAGRNRVVKACLGELKQAQTVLSRLDAALRTNQAALTVLQKRLPASQKMGEFLAGLDAVMRDCAVDLSKVTPGVAVEGTLCSQTPLRFSCHGPFRGLHEVLYRLENQERIVRVDRVLIKKGASSEDCAMDVSCRVYGR